MRERKISFLITEREMDIIESVVYLEPYLEDNLENAKEEEGGMYRIEFEEMDLSELIEALSFVTDDVKDYRRRMKYSSLLERMQKYYYLIDK